MKKNKSFKKIRPFYWMALLVGILSLTGCWSAKEINNLATINVIAIDENDAGEVEVTVVVVKPYTLFAKTAVAGNEQSKFLIETTTGENILEALGDLSSTISEKVYFGHVDAIIFGERAARERMESALDFFKRKYEFRPNIKLLVTRGSAAQLVKTMPQFNITLGLELGDLVQSNRFAATSMVKDISQFVGALVSDTTDPYTGVISSAKQNGINVENTKQQQNSQNKTGKNGVQKSESEKDQQNISEVLSLKGTAVFKGGKLKGFLDEKETRGLLWIKGELQDEIVVLNCGKNDGTVSLNLTNSKSKLSPLISDGTPKMTVRIQVEADIGQVTCSDINMDTHQINRLNQQLEGKVRQEVTSVLNKAKNQWQTDIFGFGKAINRSHPKKWKQMAPDWRKGLLRKMEIDLKVSANISRYGLIKEPPNANK